MYVPLLGEFQVRPGSGVDDGARAVRKWYDHFSQRIFRGRNAESGLPGRSGDFHRRGGGSLGSLDGYIGCSHLHERHARRPRPPAYRQVRDPHEWNNSSPQDGCGCVRLPAMDQNRLPGDVHQFRPRGTMHLISAARRAISGRRDEDRRRSARGEVRPGYLAPRARQGVISRGRTEKLEIGLWGAAAGRRRRNGGALPGRSVRAPPPHPVRLPGSYGGLLFRRDAGGGGPHRVPEGGPRVPLQAGAAQAGRGSGGGDGPRRC